DVAKAPTAAEAAKQALDKIGDALVVGPNVIFDLGFLAAAGAGRPDQSRLVDPLTLAREGYPDIQNYKLETLSSFFGIDLSQNHRALPDAEATASLLLWFAGDLPGRIEGLKAQIADAIRATRSGGDPKALLELARRNARVSKSLFGLVHKKTVRQLVLDEGI